MKFRDRLLRFSLGRYGVDQLYFGLFALWIILMIVGWCTRIPLFNALGLIPAFFMVFRSFSRNIPARRKENGVFLRFWNPVRSWFVLQRDRIRDRKTTRYRVCPACHAMIRLPVRKGKHTVPCPKCGNRFETRIF